ncbi:MAG: pyruvate formate-lyase, partial [Kiritimatiellae bacterium]|nr:pyruvate formate-lyase [Kiritimatiellia bacterium]
MGAIAVTPRIKSLLDYTFDRKQDALRHDWDWKPLTAGFIRENVPDHVRARAALQAMLLEEGNRPAFLEGERIAFTRTVRQIPELHSEEEMDERRAAGTAFGEKGVVFNITADFGPTIRDGLEARVEEMRARLQKARAEGDAEGVEFLENAMLAVDAVLGLVSRYASAARERGLRDIAETLDRVPRHGASTFREALQSLRILHYAMWCEGEYHCGLGRIDQYLLPYYEADKAAGRLDDDGALELLEEFFIACNRDSDLYIGVQQGDNGQSVMLGGVTRDGKPAFNDLSRLCLKACGELKLVDPKINLRVCKDTPLEIYKIGTELTAKGLGFPQYANDDVVIPALEKWGYAPEDARDYTVAACWEFIIPGCGMDIDNIDAVSFPGALDAALRQVAGAAADAGSEPATFEAVETAFLAEIQRRADALVEKYRHVEILPGPFVSVISSGCIEKARDISRGARYNNFGIHGTGIARAADSLAAIEKYLYTEHFRTPAQYLADVDSDFASDTEFLTILRNEAPKLGQNTGAPEVWAGRLLHAFASLLEGRTNCRGGRYRAGTGTAMYYLWHADELGASPDGRRCGEPLGTNFSASLFARMDGPVSVINSFTSPDLQETVNGGPLTLEFQQSMFREADGVEKVAQLVRYFIHCGGHQLQLNAVSRDVLLDAQAHPEKYPHLIVRVWGWSAYFVDLDA